MRGAHFVLWPSLCPFFELLRSCCHTTARSPALARLHRPPPAPRLSEFYKGSGFPATAAMLCGNFEDYRTQNMSARSPGSEVHGACAAAQGAGESVTGSVKPWQRRRPSICLPGNAPWPSVPGSPSRSPLPLHPQGCSDFAAARGSCTTVQSQAWDLGRVKPLKLQTAGGRPAGSSRSRPLGRRS